MTQGKVDSATVPRRGHRGVAVARSRCLNVLQGMLMAWAALLALIALAAPAGTPTKQLLGIDDLRPAPPVQDIALADLPLSLRLVSVIGISSVLLSLAVLLWAAARASRQAARTSHSGVEVAAALKVAATSLATSAVVLGIAWLASVFLVKRWVARATDDWGAITLATSPPPIGTIAILLLLSVVVAIAARAQGSGRNA